MRASRAHLAGRCALAGATGPAGAEQLVVSLSNHRVAVTSNFIGEDLVLFGTIEPDARHAAAASALRSRRHGDRAAPDVAHAAQGARGRHLGQCRLARIRRRAVLSRRAEQPSGHRRSPTRTRCGGCRSGSTIFCCRSASAPTSPTPCATIRSASPSCGWKPSRASIASRHGRDIPDADGVSCRDSDAAAVPTGNYAIDVKLFADGAWSRAPIRRWK